MAVSVAGAVLMNELSQGVLRSITVLLVICDLLTPLCMSFHGRHFKQINPVSGSSRRSKLGNAENCVETFGMT
jgi:hypothetical protein